MLYIISQNRLISYLSKELTEVPKKSIISFVKKGYLSDLIEYDAKLYELLLLKEQALNPLQAFDKILLEVIQKGKINIIDVSPDVTYKS
ncbi:MAG: hypothetical protein MUC49_21160 [Raineya sp.]|jgi:hypothetical protein|nr:hypothetical protein [Raineya sp.]